MVRLFRALPLRSPSPLEDRALTGRKPCSGPGATTIPARHARSDGWSLRTNILSRCLTGFSMPSRTCAASTFRNTVPNVSLKARRPTRSRECSPSAIIARSVGEGRAGRRWSWVLQWGATPGPRWGRGSISSSQSQLPTPHRFCSQSNLAPCRHQRCRYATKKFCWHGRWRRLS